MPIEVVVFEGRLPMGDGKGATMLFAQDFELAQCGSGARKLTVECEGVQILGPAEHQEISSHLVYLDHTLVGRLRADRAEFSLLPAMDAGLHRVRVEVSAFPGFRFCDDFLLKRILFHCE